MNVEEYLFRIGCAPVSRPDAETLIALHRAHMRAVPFENLDIHLNRRIVLDTGHLFDKVVIARRGGICYELNGAFGALLTALGFKTTLLSAEVFTGESTVGPQFDHMALLVEVDGVRYLCDVGFGDSFVEPLLLDERGEQQHAGFSYELHETAGAYTLLRRKVRDPEPMKPSFQFSLAPRQMSDFEAMCEFHQGPESHFARKIVCSMATGDGRVTVSGSELIVTRGDTRDVAAIGTGEHRARILMDYFGVSL